ncbi:hypothetical protein MATL_G00081220 [Megalops atlanticus]|uniref:Structural maintenance of chromosomes protein 5 n=1 Tax=Megalops atlanticus TaxID=7932 RepID=A0A9D3Q3T2_MEGAT|nr:hypothetical protein MATL_G00081220 [Megalops atlanticus]
MEPVGTCQTPPTPDGQRARMVSLEPFTMQARTLHQNPENVAPKQPPAAPKPDASACGVHLAWAGGFIAVGPLLVEGSERAVLVSPDLELQDWSCVRLRYRITGRGLLQLQLRPEGESFDHTLWAADTPSDSWLLASIDLRNTSDPCKVVLEGTGQGVSSAVALSEIRIVPGYCMGHYMYVDSVNANRPQEVARLASPMTTMPLSGCLSFYYLQSPESSSALSVFTRDRLGQGEEIWRPDTPETALWALGQVDIKAPYPLEVVFEVAFNKPNGGYVLLDDISFSPEFCSIDTEPSFDPSIANCDFESGFCGYRQDQRAGSVWRRVSVKPNIYRAGDHTSGSGSFLLANTRSVQLPGFMGRLTGPHLPGQQKYCLRFYYALTGFSRTDSALAVYLRHLNTEAQEKIWAATASSRDVWSEVDITFQKPQAVKVLFLSICESVWDCGSVALDDITVTLGDCSLSAGWFLSVPGQCDFETGSCGYTQEQQGNVGGWVLARGPTPTSYTGPQGDHTTGVGHYMYMEASPMLPGQTARLVSAAVRGSRRPHCLLFHFHMLGSGTGQLSVLLRREGGREDLLWSRRGEQSISWLKASSAQVNMAALGKRKRCSDQFANSSSQTHISRAETSSHTQDELRAAGDGGGRGFVEGSIVRITMQNFLSYNYSEVFPGPNLNMIVGPNGTGKSSIVCAICLGLAGRTAVLGRGDKVGLYVKRGCTKGFVEIELYRAQGNLVINREIYVENNQSVWMVNRRQTNQKAVEEEVRALRIQVGNLCQFLPQEKVGEFAKMSKIELLEATEKSVGPPEMYKFHCELKTFRTKEKELENVCKEKASFLERAKQRNERNRQDVERFYEKKRHLDMITMLQNKRPWVEYETVRCDLEAVKASREEAKKKLKTLRETQAPILRKIQAVDGQLRPIESQMKEKAAAIKQAMLKCKQKQDMLDTKNKEIEDTQQALRLAQTEEAERQKRISNTRCMIDDLQAELDSVAEQEDVQPQINAVSVELRQLQDERTRSQGELSDLLREKDRLIGERTRVVEKLRSLEDVMKRKEEVLRSKFPDTHNALLWLRQNRQCFTGNVYEPMMLVINVRDARHAKYIESHVPLNDLRAFVFQRQQDMETFMTEVRDHQKLRVNAVIAPPESCADRAPSRPLQALRRFGFFSYLRELFDAPEEVMSYLCHQYRVQDVPVGTQETKAMIETVIRESQLKILFTAEEKYTVKKSSYSQKTISSNSALRPPHYLSLMVDAEEKQQLQERQRSAEQRLQSIDRQLKASQELQAQLDRPCVCLSLRQMESCGTDLQRKERETGARISAVNSEKVAVMADFIQHMQLRARRQQEMVFLALDSVQLSAEKNKLESESREGGARLRELEQATTELCERKSRLQETCRQLLRRAKEVCNLDPGESSVPQRLQEAFGQLPDTLDEIDALLHEERSRAECFTGLSTTVVEEYTRGTQEIEHLTGELEEKKNALEIYRQHISQAKEKWLYPLKQLVEQINEKFSDFFRSMQCAGEVDLHSESEEEYDKYGIRIRVKFRSSTQLHELTPHHQSGGERSVSTMLYLMALQELNLCPFRVVDEINQGMDPVNERRVFDIVVRTACKGTTSQYFFITPKVLQNLHYAEEMTILCVHNGLQMLPPNKWDEKAFIRRAQRQAPPADR